MSKKKLIILIIFLSIVYSGIKLFTKYYQFGINESNSVDGSLFLIDKSNKDIYSSQYIVFLYDSIEYHQYKKGKKFIKKIGCYSKDELTFNENETSYSYFCNGDFIAQAKKRDSDNELLPHFSFTGVIPNDKYFVVGSHVKSFDSRYWGFVDLKNIVGKAKKIW